MGGLRGLGPLEGSGGLSHWKRGLRGCVRRVLREVE